jgi:hypothetical protein
MKRKLLLFAVVLVLLGVTVGQVANLPRIASAQSGGGYDLTWNVIAGGGGTSTGGAYSLSGTIGQSDASPVPLSGGSYTLNGGFWNDALNVLRLFMPVIQR